MKRKSSLQFRQQFGKILDDILLDHEPVLIERNAEAVAVVVSYETFQRKFIEHQSQKTLLDLIKRFKEAAKPSSQDSLTVLRGFRYSDYT